MGNGKRYDQEYKDMIVELFKLGMTVTEIGKEYGIANSTINGWINRGKEIRVSDEEIITVNEFMKLKKEMARIKEENEILKKAMAIFATNH
ncbi:transposase [Clostridium butyricum]|nr:transposase [Clostridium butyricum]GEQ24987.1 transposase [Clostridium butyricum]